MDSVARNVRSALIELGGRDGMTKQRIAVAARKSGLSISRAFGIWYGRARRIGVDEAEKIMSAIDKKAGLIATRAQGEAAHVAEQFEAAAARLEGLDPNFYRSSIDVLRRTARQCRGEDDLGAM